MSRNRRVVASSCCKKMGYFLRGMKCTLLLHQKKNDITSLIKNLPIMKQVKYFLAAMVCITIVNIICTEERQVSEDQSLVTMVQYIETNYPDSEICEIDKERYGYSVELANDLYLQFDTQGKLVGVNR